MIIDSDEVPLVEKVNVSELEDIPDHQTRARTLVMEYSNTDFEGLDDIQLKLEDTYVTWYCKTLQNWKACVSTAVKNGKYYEVTHNGDTGETYLDVYTKTENLVYRDSDNA